jgi:adenosine kinase
VGRVAALTAAYAIEQRGCQQHHFTRPEFLARYGSAFGPAKELAGTFAG